MLKVAMVSRWHAHANGYVKSLRDLGEERVKITAVWDEDAARGKAWATELGVDFEEDYGKLLDRGDVEAIICDAPTTWHEDLMIRAANKKKHIFTEKAMAPTVKECVNIGKAVEANGVIFVISMPQRTSAVARLAKKMIDNGTFGKISLIRIRNGHSGVSDGWLPEYWFDESATAGGALMDLGCHPMYMAAYLLDKPIKLTAMMNNPFGRNVDEAATVSILYESGAVCTGETSFVTFASPGILEVYGSEATLISCGDDVKFKSRKTAEFTDEFIVPRLPGALPSSIEQFVDACNNNTGCPKDFTVRDGIDLTLLLENAYISHKTGKTIVL